MSGKTYDEVDLEDWIVCPHCGKEDQDITDYFREGRLEGDGSTITINCIYCDEEHEVMLFVFHSFKAYVETKGGE